MRARTLPTTPMRWFLSVSTAFCEFPFPALRTTRHPVLLAFSFFYHQTLGFGLFRQKRAGHGQKLSSGRNKENDVLTDVFLSLHPHDVVWHTPPRDTETLVQHTTFSALNDIISL